MFNEIQEFYFGKKSVADNIPELIQFMSDDFMVYDIIRSAEMHSRISAGKTFLYS